MHAGCPGACGSCAEAKVWCAASASAMRGGCAWRCQQETLGQLRGRGRDHPAAPLAGMQISMVTHVMTALPSQMWSYRAWGAARLARHCTSASLPRLLSAQWRLPAGLRARRRHLEPAGHQAHLQQAPTVEMESMRGRRTAVALLWHECATFEVCACSTSTHDPRVCVTGSAARRSISRTF
jgi:hypothetical protein